MEGPFNWPEKPEDVVEEGDGKEEDGEQPTLPNDELQWTHSSIKNEKKMKKKKLEKMWNNHSLMKINSGFC